jgi:hypothetical protein
VTALERDGERFVLKRISPTVDWVVRATRDIALREGFVANNSLRLVEPMITPYLGAASDGPDIVILMPDLSDELIAWEERPGHVPLVGPATLDSIIDAIARLHAMRWADYRPTSLDWGWPWCPLRERLLLLSRPSAERYRADGLSIADGLLAGWDAFDRAAPAGARNLVAGLSADPSPLIAALAELPATGLHGDLKLGNVAFFDDGRVALIGWGLMTLAPIAVELGWLLASNSTILPVGPEEVLARYRTSAVRAAREPLRLGAAWSDRGSANQPITLPARGMAPTVGDWDAQRDLAWIVGLLLRGWRKGADVEAGVVIGSGASAVDDLALWSERAVEAAMRRL